MRYTVMSEFVKISESNGTIQNTSSVYTLEVSTINNKDSGIFVYPLNRITFSGSPIYIRCVEDDGIIDVRVATFGGISSGSAIIDESQIATNNDINNMLDDVFGN